MPNAAKPAAHSAVSYEGLLASLAQRLHTQDSVALLLVNHEDPLDLQARLGYQPSAALMERLWESFNLALRERGTVLRFGDASYCVLIGAIRNSGHAVLAADKLARAADGAMTAAGLSIKPALSIGIALYPRDAVEPEALLRKAQLASAAARKRGRRVVVYEDGCGDQILQPAQLGAAFAKALEAGALAVHYQPKVCIDDGRVVGVEALMRWLHAGQPVASPDVFIPLAENTGLIHDTTWYSLSNSLQMSAALDGLPVSVNITPGMLHHREFVQMVETAVGTWRVKRGVLTLELTEGALIADFEQATARLMHLRELGVRISIDDFGTGYSSLSYFKKIPADEIKIDKSFVTTMLEDQANGRLVEAIVTLAHQFRLEVVAEGVDDEATLSSLAACGCGYAQGYYFSPALSLDQLRQWLAQYLPVAAAARKVGVGETIAAGSSVEVLGGR